MANELELEPRLRHQLGAQAKQWRRGRRQARSKNSAGAAWLLLLCVAANSSRAHPQQPQAAGAKRPRQAEPHKSQQQQQQAPSSSSFFAQVEDLSDSSIHTKLGIFAPQQQRLEAQHTRASRIEHLADFDQLIGRLLQAASGGGDAEAPAADANNRTSMRFFRNNKTFASVVYTKPPEARKLINCHLVDLERHSSDVALYEAKYDIETRDVEFREMMQLIEACTNIARLRRRPVAAQPAASWQSAQQPLGGGGAGGSPNSKQVAGRPQVAAGQQQQQQQQQHQFQQVMSGALQRELQRIGQPVDDSNKLDLPRTRRNQLQQQQQQQQQVANSSGLGGFGRVQKYSPSSAHHKQQQQQQHMVLGEVTAPPSASERSDQGPGSSLGQGQKHLASGETGSGAGGLRDALQEITSYDTSDLLSIWRGILPGTNWCGMGDRATSYNDLGFESDIDICCRAHDFCPIRLSAFSAGYGLFNWSFYTRSHCWCDQNFLDCLQQAESPLSSVVMKFYFNIMKTTCLNDQETKVRGAPASKERSQQVARGQRAPSWWPQQQQQNGAKQQQQVPGIPALANSQWLRADVEQGKK